MFDSILSLLAPHVCLACGLERSLWCVGCRTLAPVAIEQCYACHRLSPGGRTCKSCRHKSPLYAVRAATRYEGLAKQLIWKLKFERARAGFIPVAELIASRLSLPSNGVIVPISTSTNRVRRRGYDQTVLIAKRLARSAGSQYAAPLIRLGQQQQHTATREQRLKQLEHAFLVAHPESVHGKHIILIDDVLTTGATLAAAAKALKEAGAKRVSAVVFAQA